MLCPPKASTLRKVHCIGATGSLSFAIPTRTLHRDIRFKTIISSHYSAGQRWTNIPVQNSEFTTQNWLFPCHQEFSLKQHTNHTHSSTIVSLKTSGECLSADQSQQGINMCKPCKHGY